MPSRLGELMVIVIRKQFVGTERKNMNHSFLYSVICIFSQYVPPSLPKKIKNINCKYVEHTAQASLSDYRGSSVIGTSQGHRIT